VNSTYCLQELKGGIQREIVLCLRAHSGACVCMCVRLCVFFFLFLNLLLTSMFHYRIAILHAKRFLLQTLVTPINTLYILYLSMPSYVLSSYLLNVHMEVLLLLNIFVSISHIQNLQNFKIYSVHKTLKEFCILVC